MTAARVERGVGGTRDPLSASLWLVGGLVFAFIYLPLVVVIL